MQFLDSALIIWAGGFQYCEGLPRGVQAADVTVTLEIHQPVDAICGGDGSKKITTDGEGYDHPNDGSKCVVSYVVTPLDGGDAIDTKTKFEFELGNEILSEGLEEVVLKMKKAETSECEIPADWNTYGAKVKAVVTLDDFEKEKESWSMDTAEKIAAALLPPGAALGLFAGGGEYDLALRAALLLALNVASLVLSALIVFRLRKIRPRKWIEQKNATWAVWINAALSAFFLIVAATLIVLLDLGAKVDIG